VIRVSPLRLDPPGSRHDAGGGISGAGGPRPQAAAARRFPKEIVAEVAGHFGFPPAMLSTPPRRGRSGSRRVSAARATAAFVLRQRGNRLARIAHWTGTRSHTGVIAQLRRFEQSATPEMLQVARQVLGQ